MAVGARVLVAEDDAGVRGVILRVLRQHGYEVLEASHMHEALAHWRGDAARVRIDLLITDFHMPGGTGRDLADTLWASDPELPVLFMSGDDEGVPPDEPTRCVVHLSKPFTTTRLLEQVTRLLHLRRSHPDTDPS